MIRPFLVRALLLGAVATSGLAQNSAPVLVNPVADITVYAGAPNQPVEVASTFQDGDLSPVVRMVTDLGVIDIALYERQKPITVANFFRYVDEGRYFMTDPTTKQQASSFIHRSSPGFAIQGGGFIGTVNPSTPSAIQPTQVGALPNIQNEPGISNQRSTVAMAKIINNPNSANSQWFINLRDNSASLDAPAPSPSPTPSHGGFTVFGRVISGMDVVDRIAGLPVYDRSGGGSAFNELPLENYQEPNAVSVENVVSLPTIGRIASAPTPLTFTAVSSDPAIAEVKVSDTKLLVAGKAAGTAQITVTASDPEGATATDTFNVNVNAAPGRLVNISTRLHVRTDGEVLIGGFIMRGDAPKRVMVRAIGPSLSTSSITDPLLDPHLELYDGAGKLIAHNDNWAGATSQDIVDTGIAPKHRLESAILMTLPASSSGTPYTAVVRGVKNSVGVGLVEVYDLDSGAGSTVLNIATRGRVGTAEERVMIGGFFVGGTEAKRILIRALGPSLTNAGVSNALSDPKLELRDAQGTLLQQNNDWQTSGDAAEMQSVGLAPTSSKEAALVRTLNPAPYTAIVRTNTNSAGVASVEIYQLP